jgi:hypothetical protein
VTGEECSLASFAHFKKAPLKELQIPLREPSNLAGRK